MTRGPNAPSAPARALAIALAAAAALAPPPLAASDHADPIALRSLEAGITGLFAFPDPRNGDRLVVILTVRRGLTAPRPYDVEAYEYTIYMDLDSVIDFASSPDAVVRYGGTVVAPQGIDEDIAIRFRLDADGRFRQGYPKYESFAGRPGLANTHAIHAYAGVRDDPFIFPRFDGKNVLAMAVSIPLSSFPRGQQDWLLWGTTTRGGEQIDHVGRSNRTQLGRLDFLNTLHPREHLEAIARKHRRGRRVQQALTHLMGHLMPVGAVSGLYEYLLQIRDYDLHPDVMIFTTRPQVAPGYPNGRRLEDDVAGLTCAHGDCVLQEVALIEGPFPRSTVNDKPLEPDFPYLATPHPDRPQEDEIDRCAAVFWLVVVVLLVALVLWLRRRADRDETPRVRPRQAS